MPASPPPPQPPLPPPAGIQTGAAKPNKEVVGQVTKAQVAELVQKKPPDTNAAKLESVTRRVEGTAKNLGIKVVG